MWRREGLPRKSKLDILKGNVEAQERRLREAFSTFEALKTHLSSDLQTSEIIISKELEGQQTSSSWDMLERIIGLEGDLLSSYREYSKELEKRVKKEEKGNKPPALDETTEATVDTSVNASTS